MGSLDLGTTVVPFFASIRPHSSLHFTGVAEQFGGTFSISLEREQNLDDFARRKMRLLHRKRLERSQFRAIKNIVSCLVSSFWLTLSDVELKN
jgi:hypothetical protein